MREAHARFLSCADNTALLAGESKAAWRRFTPETYLCYRYAWIALPDNPKALT